MIICILHIHFARSMNFINTNLVQASHFVLAQLLGNSNSIIMEDKKRKKKLFDVLSFFRPQFISCLKKKWPRYKLILDQKVNKKSTYGWKIELYPNTCFKFKRKKNSWMRFTIKIINCFTLWMEFLFNSSDSLCPFRFMSQSLIILHVCMYINNNHSIFHL